MMMNEDKIKLSYETLWKFIIRPPRDEYDDEELGVANFAYEDKLYKRKDYTLLNSEGYLLKCSFFEPEEYCRPSKIMPVVIYLHCNSSSRLEGMNMMEYLFEHGINLFVFDFAGSGLSEGEYISLGYHEKDDVKVIVDFVECLPGVGKIGLWGRSMGAATAMMYVHTDPRISCVVMDSPFADFKALAKQLCLTKINLPNFILDTALSVINRTIKSKNGLDINKLRPIDAAEYPNPPALFVHALEDKMVPIQHSIDLNMKYNGEKSLVSCKGGHNSVRQSYVIKRIMHFLCKHLKNEVIKISNDDEKEEEEEYEEIEES